MLVIVELKYSLGFSYISFEAIHSLACLDDRREVVMVSSMMLNFDCFTQAIRGIVYNFSYKWL